MLFTAVSMVNPGMNTPRQENSVGLCLYSYNCPLEHFLSLFIFLKIVYFYFLCVCDCLSVCIYTTCVPDNHGAQKILITRVIGEFDLPSVNVGKRTCALC